MEKMNYHKDSMNYKKDSKSPASKTIRNVMMGLIFIFVGIIISGHRIGFISGYAYNVFISWQMLLVGIGLMQILSNKNVFSGLILITIGGVFILPELLLFSFHVGNLLLPAVLIIIGIMFIFKNSFGLKRENQYSRIGNQFSVNSDYVQESYIFGGGKIIVESDNFKGGKFSAVFGGGQLDLTKATLSDEGINVLQVDLVFGGLEILIPRDWNVKIEANSVFGSFSKKGNGITNSGIDLSRVLVIKGSAVFGGAEIKRV
jgi:predicted membrane protein